LLRTSDPLLKPARAERHESESMRIARKGVSPVIATLLLILIAVAAAVLLYTWVSGLSANVAGSQVSGKTLTLIQATWALGSADTAAAATAFSPQKPVLIVSFKAPPAVVGGGGAGASLITLDNVDVIYSGRVICHYNAFALSTDDAQHTTTTPAGGATGYGVLFYGYYGTTQGAVDDEDLYSPGGIAVSTNNTPTNAAAGAVASGETIGVFTDPFVTVVAGVWEVQYVTTQKVETNFRATNANIRFDRWTGEAVNADNSGNNVDLFDLAKVGQDDWSLVVWCDKVNPNVMNAVDVRIQFQDGSTWSTTVPLTVQ